MDLLIPEFAFTITFQPIFVSQLFGFACWNILMLFIKKTLTIARIDSVIVVLTIFLGALSLLLGVYTIARDYFSASEYSQYIINDLIMNYWSFLVLKMIVIVLASQSLWFKQVRNTKRLRVMESLLIFFFLFFERIVILITGLHRDYLPSSSWEIIQSLLTKCIEMLVGFLMLTAMGYLFRLYKLIDIDNK